LVLVGRAEIIRLKLHQKMQKRVPTYFCCRPIQSRAAVDDTRSRLEREQGWVCEECRSGGIIKRAQSVVLESNTWSDEDIFTARGLPGIILASEHFKGFCEEHQFSNCLFVPAQKYSFDFYPCKRKE
jgi:hypothetical protein